MLKSFYRLSLILTIAVKPPIAPFTSISWASHDVNQNQGTVYNSANDLLLGFADAWEPFKINDIQSFLGIPLSAVLSILVALCFLHIIASTFIMKFAMRAKFSGTLLMQGLHSFIAPPLQFDWEHLYWRNRPNWSIIDCWRR